MGSSRSPFHKIEDSTEREERNLRKNPDDLFEKCSKDEMVKLQRKLERSKKIEMAGAEDEVLMAEIAEYKNKKQDARLPLAAVLLIMKLYGIFDRRLELQNETQDERDKYYRAFSAEALMIRQVEPEMFQWYTRRKELQIYPEKNRVQMMEYLIFVVSVSHVKVTESRSDNNGDRKLEILKEKRRELDKEIKVNLQQCIALLIGMRRRNQMQKRQVATI